LDVGIGLSLTFMVVPQGMSYAVLAGLPAVYGLYGACVPVLIYTLLGTSRHLAVGPTAVSSLLTGSVLRRVYPMAKLISDPNNPGELEDVQKLYNKAAIQVWNSAILQQLSCSGKTRFSVMSFCICYFCSFYTCCSCYSLGLLWSGPHSRQNKLASPLNLHLQWSLVATLVDNVIFAGLTLLSLILHRDFKVQV
jgi:hypothetical protein